MSLPRIVSVATALVLLSMGVRAQDAETASPPAEEAPADAAPTQEAPAEEAPAEEAPAEEAPAEETPAEETPADVDVPAAEDTPAAEAPPTADPVAPASAPAMPEPASTVDPVAPTSAPAMPEPAPTPEPASPPEPEPEPEPAPAAVAEPEPEPTPPEATGTDPTVGERRLVAYVASGVALVALGAGITLGVLSLDGYACLEDVPACNARDGMEAIEGEDFLDRKAQVETTALFADMAYVVAAAATVVAVTGYIRGYFLTGEETGGVE